MRGSTTFRVLPGNQQGAFARVRVDPVNATVVSPPTLVAEQLTWRQTFIKRSVRTRLLKRSVKYTFTDFGVRQVFIGN